MCILQVLRVAALGFLKEGAVYTFELILDNYNFKRSMAALCQAN